MIKDCLFFTFANTIQYNIVIYISITTYNRPEMLVRLTQQLTTQHTKHRYKILIFDDNSDIYPYNDIPPVHMYQRVSRTRGKVRFWKTINEIFEFLRFKNFDYFIQLQDDIVLCDNFIDKAVESYEAIKDPKKISLYLHEGESRKDQPCWTNVYPVTVEWGGSEFSITQWVDMCAFIVKNDFLEALNYEIQPISESRWAKDQTLSSGVGQQISRRLYKDYHLYRKPLVIHGDHKSVMHV